MTQTKPAQQSHRGHLVETRQLVCPCASLRDPLDLVLGSQSAFPHASAPGASPSARSSTKTCLFHLSSLVINFSCVSSRCFLLSSRYDRLGVHGLFHLVLDPTSKSQKRLQVPLNYFLYNQSTIATQPQP